MEGYKQAGPGAPGPAVTWRRSDNFDCPRPTSDSAAAPHGPHRASRGPHSLFEPVPFRLRRLPSSSPTRSGPHYPSPWRGPHPHPPSGNSRSAPNPGGRPPTPRGRSRGDAPGRGPLPRGPRWGRGRGGGLAARALGGEPAPPRRGSAPRPPALRSPGRPRHRRPAKLPPCGRHPPRPRPVRRAPPGGCHLEARRAPRWRDRGAGPGGGRRRARAGRRPHLLLVVRPSLPGAGGGGGAARSAGRADGRPVLSLLLVRLPSSLARPPLPPPGSRPLAHRDERRGRRGFGRPQAPAGLESGGWNPPGALNSRAPRCCVSASSWGPGPGGRSGGRGRAGPSGGRARLARAGGRQGPDGRGRRPDGRAAGAGLRDPLRRSRFPHKLPESGASAALLPASSSPANQRRAPRQAPPISRPALRWPRQPIRPSAPPPAFQPIRIAGRSSRRRGQHEAAGGGGAGSGGAWGEGYGAKGGGGGMIFFAGFLGFLLVFGACARIPW